MKKALLTLLIPTILGLGSCKQEIKEPIKDDYDSWVAPFGYEFMVKDLDSDGQVDAITRRNSIALFYAEGYEDKVDKLSSSRVMSPEMRESATNFLKACNEFNYQIAKDKYRQKKK